MSQTINVYCDESCHQEHDRHGAMVIGAVWCPLDQCRNIGRHLRGLKALHGLSPAFEVKWTKVSPAKAGLYLEVLDYFFENEDLHFRALIAPAILHPSGPAVKVWGYRKGNGRIRTYVWLEDLDYVVVLQKRPVRTRRGPIAIAFLVTAFHLDGEGSRRWFRRSYEARCPQNAIAALADGERSPSTRGG